MKRRTTAPAHAAKTSRRGALKGMLAGAAATLAAGGAAPSVRADEDPAWKIKNGRINQSVVPWCFKGLSVEDLCKAGVALGLKSIELCSPSEWPTLKKYGLTCAIAGSHGFVKGFNNPEHHAECSAKIIKSIDDSAAFGCPSVITFSGMRGNLTDEEGLKNTIDGLKKVIGHAEKNNITLCIEMLNSRVDVEMKGHPGYMCDNLPFAKKVCDGVGSPRMKILFDFYHVQIMHGDIIVRMKELKDYIGHLHTAGVPGRNEIDDTQEINYTALMRGVVEIGYKGYVGQEFIPKYPDKIASLRQAVRICDV